MRISETTTSTGLRRISAINSVGCVVAYSTHSVGIVSRSVLNPSSTIDWSSTSATRMRSLNRCGSNWL